MAGGMFANAQTGRGWTFNFQSYLVEEPAMPLKKGKSQATVSSNIKTLVDDWKKTGSIGTSHPKSKKKAVEQAVAIAMGKARTSRKTT